MAAAVAKGMTAIGIIRALEENNIPIDYITGTSMELSSSVRYMLWIFPDDMEALLRSGRLTNAGIRVR